MKITPVIMKSLTYQLPERDKGGRGTINTCKKCGGQLRPIREMNDKFNISKCEKCGGLAFTPIPKKKRCKNGGDSQTEMPKV